MKTILLIFVLCVSFSAFSYGQCVIYVDEETGAFGAGFNNDGTPTSIQDCKDMAIKLCKENGGSNCKLLYQSNKQGWWAFITGLNQSGELYFQGIDGAETKSEAENEVRKKYRQGGGKNPDDIKVYSWYVYSNPK